MALSGTLDTFALPDVMRLLASTSKTGRLRVTGQRGSGSVWLESGAVAMTELVGAPIPGSTNAEDLFALLRLETGSFTFEGDVTAAFASDTEPMELVLSSAESMLSEWREIESVVPSMDVWVGLKVALDGPDVMVDAERWRGIAAIGSGTAVVGIAHRLELHEVAVCRLVKELIELGLVELIDEPELIEEVEDAPESETMAAFEPEPEPEIATDTYMEFDREVDPEPLASIAFGDDPALDPLLSAGDPLSDLGHFDGQPSHGSLFSGASSTEVAGESLLNPAEMARQLANLSPRAAKAVAEAARATTDEERDAALAAVEAEDDTVNRGLLLKFLGSVES